MGGIGLQNLFIVIFLGLAVKFHPEMSELERQKNGKAGVAEPDFHVIWSLAFITVYIQPEFE